MANEANLKQYAQQVLDLVNQHRRASGLGDLSWRDDLYEVAKIRADEIATRSFSHTRPDGTDCGQLLDSRGLRWCSWGENLADGQRSAQEVVNSWMSSAQHKANILNPAFKSLGVAAKEKGLGFDWVQVFYS